MKKRVQKRLGNKGFSLVELIVVIAIMAVLVGVLAPTLIGNIEKSRESKDINTLDSVYAAVQTAYGDEAGNTAAKSISNLSSGVELSVITGTTGNAFASQILEYLGGSLPTLTSSAAKGSGHPIMVKVDGSKVSVWAAKSTDAKTDALPTTKIKNEDDSIKNFIVE